MILAMVLFFVGPAFAASNVSFQWDPNTESDLAGYKLYQGTSSGLYDSVVADIPAGTETVTLFDVPDGTYFWALTAYDLDDNESGYSNEVTESLDSTAPTPPQNFIRTLIEKILAWLFGGMRVTAVS